MLGESIKKHGLKQPNEWPSQMRSTVRSWLLFVLPIIAKGVAPMPNKKLEKLKLGNTFKYEQSQTYIVESKEYDDENDNPVFTVG